MGEANEASFALSLTQNDMLLLRHHLLKIDKMKKSVPEGKVSHDNQALGLGVLWLHSISQDLSYILNFKRDS